MNYLVGDVQGCDDALHRLLQAVGFSPSRDHLTLLGDLVNRGPSSLAVLRRVVALGSAAQCILGNHDLHLLAVSQGARALHRGDTFSDVLSDVQAPSWIDWLRRQPLACLSSGWLCVHAGVPPQWSAQQTLELAGEVQALLHGPDLAQFLLQMYGNEPDHWQDSLQGANRARFVVNALTRMRFCTAEGRLDFKTKEGAGGAPAGFMPWFEVPGRATADHPVAFGHWSTLGAINRPDLLATDTGCVWGGCLTAVRVDSGRREFVQVRCEQAQRPG